MNNGNDMNNIIINDNLIDAIDARYYDMGGDYYGRDSIVQFARYTLDNGFVGSVDDFINDVASDLRQND
jgi:hypothetical protein